MKTIIQYIKELGELNKIVYKQDSNYELFLQEIKYLPEETLNNLIKKYLDLKAKHIEPNIKDLLRQ